MAVDRVDAAAFTLTEQRRHLGIRPSTGEFELPESLGQRRVGEVDRVGEQLLEHGSIIANDCTLYEHIEVHVFACRE